MPKESPITGRSAFTLCAVLFLLSSCCYADDLLLDESWDVIYLASSKVGFAHTETLLRQTGSESLYVTRIETQMELVRGADAARVTTASDIIENEQGKIVGFSSKMATSGQPVEAVGRLADGKFKVEQTALGRTREYEMEMPSEVIGPVAATRLMKEKGFAPGTSYGFRTYEPDVAKVFSMKIQVLGKEEVEILGTKRQLHKLEATQSILPMMTIYEWCDGDGVVMKTEIKQLAMVTLKATKEEALRASKSPPIDFMKRLSVPCNIVIPHPYLTSEASYVATSLDPNSTISAPSSSTQTVRKEADGIYINVATRAYAAERSLQVPIKAPQLVEFTEPSTYIQSDDPRIVSIAQKVAGNTRNSYEVAMALCEWVGDNVLVKNFSVGFATAGEVAKHLEGDCTEHAVLLAALLRAAGIPSKCVVGVLYAKGQFYYHLWNEAFVSEWMPLDATLKRGGNSWDAVHIRLAETSASSSTPFLDLAAIFPALGNMKIDVLNLKVEGVEVDVKELSKADFILGNRYENVIYSFAFEKPRSASFELVRPVLSSNTIVRVRGPRDDNAELSVEVRSCGFAVDLNARVRAEAASGNELSQVQFESMGGRKAVRFVSQRGSVTEYNLLIHDRDALIRIRAKGSGKWQKRLFEKAVKTFAFTDTK